MPENDRRGLLWPLATLFTLAMFGAFVGLLSSALAKPYFDNRTLLTLLLIAGLSGWVLYWPRLLLAAKVTDLATLAGRINALEQAITANGGQPQRIADLRTAITDLRLAVTNVQTTATGVQTTATAVQTAVTALPNTTPSLAAITAAIAALQADVTAIRASANAAIDMAALRDNVKSIRDDIDKKLQPK